MLGGLGVLPLFRRPGDALRVGLYRARDPTNEFDRDLFFLTPTAAERRNLPRRQTGTVSLYAAQGFCGFRSPRIGSKILMQRLIGGCGCGLFRRLQMGLLDEVISAALGAKASPAQRRSPHIAPVKISSRHPRRVDTQPSACKSGGSSIALTLHLE